MLSKTLRNDLWIVIAAYNEGNGIRKVITDLQKAGYEHIVVVDDGSKDMTWHVIDSLPVHALRHAINRGQGAALKTGIDYALEQGASFIVTFDADGQHRVKDLPAMVEPVANGECDVTLGSRFLGSTKNMPWMRYVQLKVAVIIQWIFYGLLLSDAHNGFRCFSRKAAQHIEIMADRMEHASEIIEEIRHHNLAYREVPVVILYTDETLQKGHGGLVQGMRILSRMIFKKLR